MKKHLIYAEDLVYELMQYPSGTVPKAAIRSYADQAISTKSISIWRHVWNRIVSLFKKGY